MSGEKCGQITVQKPNVLFRALQELNQARRNRQRERERQRNEARLERERQALASAKAQLKGLREDLAALNARAADYERNFNGIKLPNPPQLPSVEEADAGAILAFVADNEATVARYRSKLNEAMLQFRREQAVGEGRDEVLEWYSAYAPATSRTADNVIGAADNEALFGRQGQDKELRRIVFERARKLMAKVDGQVSHISDELRQKLKSVLSAASHSEAQIAAAHLEGAVSAELKRVAVEKIRRQEEQKRLQTDRVAALMAQSLEEMGYVVSGVDESAYTKDRQIIACNPEQPDHAVRLTMDPANGQVRSNVVRLVEPATASSTRTSEQQEQDKEADARWCNAQEIGCFRGELKKKGVDVGFSPTQGQQQIDYVFIEDVLEASPSLGDHFNRERPELRQRSLDRRNT